MIKPVAPRQTLLTPAEAAQRLAMSKKTVLRRIESGAISAVRDGRMLRIQESELERYIAEHRTS